MDSVSNLSIHHSSYIDWLADWLAGWLASWPVDWLIHWFIHSFIRAFIHSSINHWYVPLIVCLSNSPSIFFFLVICVSKLLNNTAYHLTSLNSFKHGWVLCVSKHINFFYYVVGQLMCVFGMDENRQLLLDRQVPRFRLLLETGRFFKSLIKTETHRV